MALLLGDGRVGNAYPTYYDSNRIAIAMLMLLLLLANFGYSTK
jgi:hypothetical protein